ncbi:MAG: MFS transporter [bacterium]
MNAEKRITLIASLAASFLTPFMVASVNVALPAIGREFSMDAVLMSWVGTSYLLAAAVFLIPIGRLSDIIGRKKIFLWGTVAFSATSLLTCFSSSPAGLIIMRVVQGLSSAMIFATGMAIVTSVFPAGERGKAIGINITATYAGLSIGPFLGGLLTGSFGWRSIFLATALAGAAVAALVFFRLKSEWAEAEGEKFDSAGAVVYSLSFASLIYGFSLLPSAAGMLLAIAGLSGGLGFFRMEAAARHPLMNLKAFRRNYVFIFSNLAALINYAATFASGFLLSLYLQYIKGFSPGKAGLVLAVQPAVMAMLSAPAGHLSDRVKPRTLALAGMSVTALGLFFFAFLEEGTDVSSVCVALAVLGLGFALFSSPNTNAVMSSVQNRFYGVASATLGTMRLTGQTVSMSAAALIFSLHLGKAEITPAYHLPFLEAVRTSFGLFTILCLAGIFVSFISDNPRKHGS